MIRTNSRRMGSKYYSRYLAHYAKKNYMLLLLGALFVAGVAIGTVMTNTAENDTLAALFRVVNGFIEKRREQTLLQNLLSTAMSSLTFITIMFVCGFCAISQPAVLLAPFFRGLGFGFSAASLYSSYGARATGFIAFLILPDMLISSLAILLCCRESLRLANSFWGAISGNNGGEFYSIKIFLGRYVAAGVLCVLSAFFEAVLYFAFANQFILG